MPIPLRQLSPVLVVLLSVLAVPTATTLAADGKTSHKGWPKINGMLLINRVDQNRTLDARPGRDPFAFQDPRYRCDGYHLYQGCFVGSAVCVGAVNRRGRCNRFVVKTTKRHNELLGGHGSDSIFAGPNGDVIWGDYKPNGPTTQVDILTGGNGRDFIYASHGANTINAGDGNDWVKAHWGRGSINCGPGYDLLFISHRNQPLYRVSNCEKISHRGVGPR